MKTRILFISLLLFTSSIFSQTNYSPETLEKIKEVENNITGNIILNDERPNTILERMAKYKVNGLSMAVIHDYKIVCTKGNFQFRLASSKIITIEKFYFLFI